MPLASILDAAVFKDGVLNLGFKSRGFEWSPDKVQKCASVIRQIVDHAPRHSDAVDKVLMTALDKVMLRFHPHHGRWDDPLLHAFLVEKAIILEKVADDQPVGVEELEILFKFCEEMWIELVAHANRNGS